MPEVRVIQLCVVSAARDQRIVVAFFDDLPRSHHRDATDCHDEHPINLGQSITSRRITSYREDTNANVSVLKHKWQVDLMVGKDNDLAGLRSQCHFQRSRSSCV